jgi:hypothetical protein
MFFRLSAPIVALIASLMLRAIARRGRQGDEHPVCRKCRFDLFGRPDTSERCPECGADIRAPRAIRIGNRDARRRLLVISRFMIVGCCVWTGIVAWRAARDVDWIRKYPLWLVRFEATRSDPATHDSAIAELRRRMAAGRLSDEDLMLVADDGLNYQRQSERTWTPAWGDLLEHLHTKGKLSAAQWTRYWQQGLVLKLMVRPRIRRGDAIPLRFTIEPDRTGTVTDSRVVDFDATFRLEGIDPVTVRCDAVTQFHSSLFDDTFAISPSGRHVENFVLLAGSGNTVRGWNIELSPADWMKVQKRLALSVIAKCTMEEFDSTATAPRVEKSIECAIVPADESTVTPCGEEFSTATIRGVFTTPMISQYQLHQLRQTSVVIEATRTPVPLAFSVWLRVKGEEHYLGPLAHPCGPLGAFRFNYINEDAEDEPVPKQPAPAEIVLRSDPRVAICTLDQGTFWVGEVVLKSEIERRP